ncbi:hypothetical protein ILUMI_03178 [Ignelater luminosus]|uniref:Uncharacterized protein n=1 Tax=Ignelater luminosus TaxID=2038154 RepID=A0A8K0DC24_IGNLU|nr:hypothetical protein ILUMI_03178 [Ignelater luminosus]
MYMHPLRPAMTHHIQRREKKNKKIVQNEKGNKIKGTMEEIHAKNTKPTEFIKMLMVPISICRRYFTFDNQRIQKSFVRTPEIVGFSSMINEKSNPMQTRLD